MDAVCGEPPPASTGDEPALAVAAIRPSDATHLLEMTGHIGVVGAGLLVIAYLSGFLYLLFYYKTLGCPWMLGCVPAQQFVLNTAAAGFALGILVVLLSEKGEPIRKWSRPGEPLVSAGALLFIGSLPVLFVKYGTVSGLIYFVFLMVAGRLMRDGLTMKG